MPARSPRPHPIALLKTVCIGLPVFTLAALAALLLGITVHVANWIARGGRHVDIPWTSDHSPRLSPAEMAVDDNRRTRDPSRVHLRKDCNCSLVFWKMTAHAGADSNLVNFLAGFNGCSHVTIDCCVSDAQGPMMIESGTSETNHGLMDGPQFTPLRHWQGRGYARVHVGRLIDCDRLYRDLAKLIANPKARQKTLADWLDFALGRMNPEVVTCSGLIGEAILKQQSSPLAAALREAMLERITYGEITPNDLARTMAMIQAHDAHPGFRQVPVLSAILRAIR